jgi:hypothetical protein
MRVATWNVRWAKGKTPRGRRVAAVLAAMVADVLIVTEGSAAVLASDGYSIDAGSEWGYGPNEHRRKVLMWREH